MARSSSADMKANTVPQSRFFDRITETMLEFDQCCYSIRDTTSWLHEIRLKQ